MKPINIKRLVLTAVWAALIILLLTLPLYDSFIVMRGYGNTFATSDGRNFFVLLAEGYESAFVYELPVYIYILLALVASIVLCAVTMPRLYRSAEDAYERALEADDAARSLARLRGASLPWLPAVLLCGLMSMPELACIVINLELDGSDIFLPNNNGAFAFAVIFRLLLVGAVIAVSILSNRMIARKIHAEALELYEANTVEGDDSEKSDDGESAENNGEGEDAPDETTDNDSDGNTDPTEA
ncbi:MAG: hypothetical protein IJX38_00150 [Clostridia bacterium]|nr:hypothetical protein [Clostridia bacterium]